MFEENEDETYEYDENYYRDESQIERENSSSSLIIYIKTLLGNTITLNVTESETVENLKLKIQKSLGVPVWKQMLVYACKILEENTILSDYNIKNESSIFLIIRFNTSKIYIKTIFDKTISIDYDQALTIENIKKQIEEKENIKINKQMLIYNAIILENNKTLTDYDIKKESNISLIILEEHEKLNEELKKKVKQLEKELSDEKNKNKNLENNLKDLENLYNDEKKKNFDLKNKIMSLESIINDEKKKNLKELEIERKKFIEETKKSEEYKNKIEKIEKKIGKKRYTKDDFLDIKNYLIKEKEKDFDNIEKYLISINFISNEEDIYWTCICKKDDNFSKLENNFYRDYPEFNKYNNYFIFNGIEIKKEKTLKDIGIKSNSIIFIKKTGKKKIKKKI